MLLAVFALAFPFITGDQANIDAAGNATAYACLALGLNIVVGFCGLLDLGYAAFFAIGAYSFGILTSWQITPEWSGFWSPFAALGLVQKVVQNGAAIVHFTVSFWIMLPLSGVIAAFFGVLFGAPTLRLKGDYLAIVTLGFGEIVPIVARNWTGLTNGAAGLNGIASPTIFSYKFGIDATPYYYVGIVLVVAFLIFASTRLRDSRIGRAWMAIRDDEIAASAMGINLTRFKLLAFGIGAGFAGMSGTFYVAKLQTATPDMFGFPGFRHDPGHGRAGRARQRLGRGARRRAAATAAILVPRRPHPMGERLRHLHPQRLSEFGRSHPGERTALRHHPGDHDAVSAAGAHSRQPPPARAELRAAARHGTDAETRERRDAVQDRRRGLSASSLAPCRCWRSRT